MSMKKLGIALVIIIAVVSVLFIACTSVVLGAKHDVEEQVIISRACKEMQIAPEHTALTELSVEYVPWLRCDVYNYALEADEDVYVVGVKKLGDKVLSVDVIEQVESLAAAKEAYQQ